MYSNKESVNILTALLRAYGVGHAVVCPGSRNSPIVHNLNECPAIRCYPVTDERSAGFYAIGMIQALGEPVVVCVTSGTALLNLMPAVTEAWYQHLPLIVVSADRPQRWIDQLDGQTLPQPGALGAFVRRSVSLPEDDAWHSRRLVCEALLDATTDDPRPVHINVPISEPLFTFDVAKLPAVHPILRTAPTTDYSCLHSDFISQLVKAERPMIVFGQSSPHDFEGCDVNFLFSHVIVLHEALAPFPHASHFDEVLFCEEREARNEEEGAGSAERILPPDFIIYVGDTIVSKRLRRFLRTAKDARTWRISSSGAVEDTFQNLCGIIVGDAEFVLQALSHKISHMQLRGAAYRRQWLAALIAASHHADRYQPAYSQMAAVKLFEEQLSATLAPGNQTPAADGAQNEPLACHVHYANSTAVRLANIYSRHHVWCNRGVNGIEGSLSTAAGFAVATATRTSATDLRPQPVFCVIGDLSFFYDQNALWNQNIGEASLRILLLNNGGGGIFNMLNGLEKSPAQAKLVAAAHQTCAEGICSDNQVTYLRAEDMEQLQQGLHTLLTTESTRPVLLEVFTDAATDANTMRDYFITLSKLKKAHYTHETTAD